MGVLKEISNLVKKAQLDAFGPQHTGDNEIDTFSQLANAKLHRGFAKGVKETIPGFIDGTIGTASGLINGIGQWLGGGSFRRGWKDSTDFVRKYYSDPIRNAEMALGGNAVKKMYDNAIEGYDRDMKNIVGPAVDEDGLLRKRYWEYVNARNDVDSWADGLQKATEVGLSWPMFSKAVGPVIEAMAKPIGGAAKGFGAAAKSSERIGPWAEKVVSSAKKISDAASPVMKPIDKGVRYLYDSWWPYALVNGRIAAGNSGKISSEMAERRMDGFEMLRKAFGPYATPEYRRSAIESAKTMLGQEGMRELHDANDYYSGR